MDPSAVKYLKEYSQKLAENYTKSCMKELIEYVDKKLEKIDPNLVNNISNNEKLEKDLKNLNDNISDLKEVIKNMGTNRYEETSKKSVENLNNTYIPNIDINNVNIKTSKKTEIKVEEIDLEKTLNEMKNIK